MADEAARRAGRALAARRRGHHRAEDPYADEWPELRREILRGGGIGPSRDWDSSSWPGDLYRAGGKAPDLVATETFLGYSDRPPWGEGGNDDTMHRYLERAYTRHRLALEDEKRRRADEDEDEEETPAAARRRPAGAHLSRRERTEREASAHSARMAEFVARWKAARANRPRPAAIAFYTDRKDVVHPITTRSAQAAGQRYALRRGR